jgi:hypothetical protein
MKFELSQQIFEKYSVKFHENQSSGSRAAPCGRTEDMTQLMVAFRNLVYASKNYQGIWLEGMRKDRTVSVRLAALRA